MNIDTYSSHFRDLATCGSGLSPPAVLSSGEGSVGSTPVIGSDVSEELPNVCPAGA